MNNVLKIHRNESNFIDTLALLVIKIYNHLGSNPVIRFETKNFALLIVSGSNSVVANMMVTGDLHDR